MDSGWKSLRHHVISLIYRYWASKYLQTSYFSLRTNVTVSWDLKVFVYWSFKVRNGFSWIEFWYLKNLILFHCLFHSKKGSSLLCLNACEHLVFSLKRYLCIDFWRHENFTCLVRRTIHQFLDLKRHWVISVFCKVHHYSCWQLDVRQTFSISQLHFYLFSNQCRDHRTLSPEQNYDFHWLSYAVRFDSLHQQTFILHLILAASHFKPDSVQTFYSGLFHTYWATIWLHSSFMLDARSFLSWL